MFILLYQLFDMPFELLFILTLAYSFVGAGLFAVCLIVYDKR